MSVRLFCVFRGYLLFVDFLQQLVEFLLADRLGVVESLGCVAAAFMQELRLLLGFHALGDDVQPDVLGH